MANMKKTGLMDGAGSEDDYKYDPEGEEESNAGKYRLPFALCKQKGIAIQDWWTPRDAWEALKRGGHVDDVSEEYADYYREQKKADERAKRKERAKKKKERQARIDEQKSNSEHVPEKNYTHKPGAIAGADKGKPMNFEQADGGSCNPYYNKGLIGYRTNCQTCVPVFIARLQGYDVRALPNLDNREIAALSRNTRLAYKTKDGGLPEYIHKPRGEKNLSFLDKNIKQGEIYSIEFGWKGRSTGHVLTAQRGEDGKVRLYDPQINQVYDNKTVSAYLSRTENVRLMNLTNVTINEEYCDKIMKRA